MKFIITLALMSCAFITIAQTKTDLDAAVEVRNPPADTLPLQVTPNGDFLASKVTNQQLVDPSLADGDDDRPSLTIDGSKGALIAIGAYDVDTLSTGAVYANSLSVGLPSSGDQGVIVTFKQASNIASQWFQNNQSGRVFTRRLRNSWTLWESDKSASWSLLEGVPAGFLDGTDDVGLISEVDPTVPVIAKSITAADTARWAAQAVVRAGVNVDGGTGSTLAAHAGDPDTLTTGIVYQTSSLNMPGAQGTLMTFRQASNIASQIFHDNLTGKLFSRKLRNTWTDWEPLGIGPVVTSDDPYSLSSGVYYHTGHVNLPSGAGILTVKRQDANIASLTYHDNFSGVFYKIKQRVNWGTWDPDGDDLGNSIALQNINIGTYFLSPSGSNEGVRFASGTFEVNVSSAFAQRWTNGLNTTVFYLDPAAGFQLKNNGRGLSSNSTSAALESGLGAIEIDDASHLFLLPASSDVNVVGEIARRGDYFQIRTTDGLDSFAMRSDLLPIVESTVIPSVTKVFPLDVDELYVNLAGVTGTKTVSLPTPLSAWVGQEKTVLRSDNSAAVLNIVTGTGATVNNQAVIQLSINDFYTCRTDGVEVLCK